jgi:hypothetical protein
MKRAKENYITAQNGLEALQTYKLQHAAIKLIFMGTPPFSSPCDISVKAIADKSRYIYAGNGWFNLYSSDSPL